MIPISHLSTIPSFLKKNCLFIGIFSLFFIKALIFTFFVTPWQTPDEPFHFCSVERNRPELRNEILKSIEIFKSLEYMEQSRVSVHASSPTLFNNISQFYLKKFSNDNSDVVSRLYCLRLLFAFFSLLTIYIIYLTAKNITSYRDTHSSQHKTSNWQPATHMRTTTPIHQSPIPLAAASFACLHPQFSFLTLGVNPDVLTFLVISAIVFLLTKSLAEEVKILETYNSVLSVTRKKDSHPPSFLCVLRVLCGKFLYWKHITFILLTFILTYTSLRIDRQAYVSLPLLTFGLPLIFIIFNRNLILIRLTQLGIVLSTISLAIFISCKLGYVNLNSIIRVKGEIYYQLNLLKATIPKFTEVPISSYLRYFGILFISFWFSYGWMVYKMSFGWYVLFGMISLAACIGLIKLFLINVHLCKSVAKPIFQSPIRVNLCKFVINKRGIFLLLILIFFAFVMLISKSNPLHMAEYVNTRFIFTSMPAVAILFVLGIWGILTGNPKEYAAKGIIIFMLFLNGISVFKYLMPIFYL